MTVRKLFCGLDSDHILLKSNNFLGLDSDLELDSLETDLILDDDGDIDDEDDCLEEDSIQAIPAPVWPNR